MPPSFITCRLTGKSGPGIDAHIIPKSFFPLEDVKEGRALSVFHAGERPFVNRSWAGEYDSSILTKEGEAYFAGWDDYAADFFLRKTKDARLIKDGDTHAIFLAASAMNCPWPALWLKT